MKESVVKRWVAAARGALLAVAMWLTPLAAAQTVWHVDDLTSLLRAWGPAPGEPADFSGDGVINAYDLAALLRAWGPCPN